MSKMLRATLLACLLLTGTTPTLAQTDRTTAEKLMRASGMWQQLEAVGRQIRMGQSAALSQANTKLASDEIEQIARIAEKSFAAERLRRVALDVVAKDTDPVDVPAVLAWYESREGIAITRIEEKAAMEERDPRETMREGAALMGTLSKSRQAMLARFVEVTKSAEGLTKLTINSTIAIQMGAASANPTAPAVSASELRNAMEAQRPQMLKAFSDFSLASSARMYADVPDADLAKYIAFLQSAAGAHFTEVGLRALDAALVDAAADFGRNFPMAREKSPV